MSNSIDLAKITLEEFCEHRKFTFAELEEFHPYLEKKLMFLLIKDRLSISIPDIIEYFTEKAVDYNIYYRYSVQRHFQVKINDEKTSDYVNIHFSTKGTPYFAILYNNKETWSPDFEGITNDYLKGLVIDLYNKFLNQEEDE